MKSWYAMTSARIKPRSKSVCITAADFGAVAPSWEGLKLGVAYDVVALSNFNQYNGGSFELMINYCYKITPPVKIRKYRTVKWL